MRISADCSYNLSRVVREVCLASQVEMVVVLLRYVFSQRDLAAKNHMIGRVINIITRPVCWRSNFGKDALKMGFRVCIIFYCYLSCSLWGLEIARRFLYFRDHSIPKATCSSETPLLGNIKGTRDISVETRNDCPDSSESGGYLQLLEIIFYHEALFPAESGGHNVFRLSE
jgi:hypothetical protein